MMGCADADADAADLDPVGDTFDRAIAELSEAYADQNERDDDALVRAEQDGLIEVQRRL